MTTYFIDPSAATNGNGLTPLTPMNTLPASFGIGTVSNKYLLKAGTTFVGERTYSCVGAGAEYNARVVFGSYGVGAKPKWVSNLNNSRCLRLASSARRVTVQGIDFWSNGWSCIDTDSLETNYNVDVDIKIIDCYFSMSATNDYSPVSDRNALKLYGANVKITGCEFDGIPTDAIWFAGESVEISYNKVSNVASDGRYAGDCVQAGGGINSPCNNAWIHHNFLDHQNSPGKQCIVINYGNGMIVEDNVLLHVDPDTPALNIYSTNVIYSDPSCIVRRNFIKGARNGVYIGGNDDSTLVESNIIVFDSAADALDPNNTGFAFRMTTSTARTVFRNNTVISPKLKAYCAIRVGSGDAHLATTPHVISNNVIVGFATDAILGTDSPTYYVATANVVYACGSGSTHLTNYGIGTIKHLDPSLNEEYVPQEQLIAKAGIVGATLDFNGNTFVGAIGAVQPTAAQYSRNTPSFSTP